MYFMEKYNLSYLCIFLFLWAISNLKKSICVISKLIVRRFNIYTHVESCIYVWAERTDFFAIIRAHRVVMLRQGFFPYLFTVQLLISCLWEPFCCSSTHHRISVIFVSVLCFVEWLWFVCHYFFIYCFGQFCRISQSWTNVIIRYSVS